MVDALTTPTAAETYGANDVQTRVKNIASEDSMLNQMARTEAAKVMNSRGMLNSSMYAGAAQDAVLRQAVPIASQESNQAFQASESALSRASAEGMQAKDLANQQTLQQKDITFRQGEGALDRASQEKLASWNLKSQDRDSASRFLTGMETMYQSAYQSIMANTNLDAKQREAQLTAAKTMRDKQLNFVEQMYNIDLKW
ncbi:MAG: hypothetical protein E5V63_04095 [Mesorhizobium sp.]|nr:MAG: hypothetical protein E5V63_04095 [Mesorhizobium sp.]